MPELLGVDNVRFAGITVEGTDPSGNVVGFAVYSKRPEMARR